MVNTPPKIEYLKMAEAAKLKGQFQHFDATQRNDKLKECVAIIKRHLPQWAIHVTVDIGEWWRVIAQIPQNAQRSLLHGVLGILLEYVARCLIPSS